MRGWLLHGPSPARERPLGLESIPDPVPLDDEILIEVSACGICRTDLHIVEGELAVPDLPVIPGHQAVGRVVGPRREGGRFAVGDRVGVAWVHRLCGRCPFCASGRENLCERPLFTGFHRPGGFAERIAAPEAFVHPLPEELGGDVAVAPLLCAGIIGYRALRRSGLRPGRRLALYGFGAAAHIAIQIARAWGCDLAVVTRERAARERALAMGASWAGGPGEKLPWKAEHAVSFAPAGAVLPEALENLERGGTLAVAGVHLDRIPPMDYGRHLFQERSIVSVTASTRADARELLALAARIPVRTDVEAFGFEEAGEALLRLKEGRLAAQAAVLRVGGEA